MVFLAVKSSLAKDNLHEIQSALKDAGFASSDWEKLGLALGLHIDTLRTIERDKVDVDQCLSKCLTLWLEKADQVKETTWSTLANALEDINNKSAADFISKQKKVFIYSSIYTFLGIKENI